MIPVSQRPKQGAVHILVLSGSEDDALRFSAARHPGAPLQLLSKRELREGGWKRQREELRKLHGQAFVVWVDELAELQEPLLLRLTILFHHCRETVIADRLGATEVVRRGDLWRFLPEVALSLAADALVFGASWILLRVWRLRLRLSGPVESHPVLKGDPSRALDVAFLYPYPRDRHSSGGAMSHVKGFLSGLLKRSARCEIFSGRPLPLQSYPVREIPPAHRPNVFRESAALSYNLRFARDTVRALAGRTPRFLYQRHGRFVVAGALLSGRLRRPLVLEYNGSETWMAKHWDPTRFGPWLELAEQVSLASAALVVVVSEASRDELVGRGFPRERVLVNPNAVDPSRFHPGAGGTQVRETRGFALEDVVVGFIGTWSYFHGVPVLGQAIEILLAPEAYSATRPRLRFLLIGDGSLAAEVRARLERFRAAGTVVFTGQIPHGEAPAHLDAADILVSPHVPMPDGTPFFGSPTKLYEYMAMGKAIVASDLDQIAAVLRHGETAWLVPPGNAAELAGAIQLLAERPEIREKLGRRAREMAVERHSWERNAERVLAYMNVAESNQGWRERTIGGEQRPARPAETVLPPDAGRKDGR